MSEKLTRRKLGQYALYGAAALGGARLLNLPPLGDSEAMAQTAGSSQRNWRWCGKCQGLAYAGNTFIGPCVAGGQHEHTSSYNYMLPTSPGSGQSNWRWCGRCQGLGYAGNGGPGRCPAGGLHDHSVSADYCLPYTGTNGQGNWRWCGKCQNLAFAGNGGPGPCPAGGTHNHSVSANYVLPFTAPSFVTTNGGLFMADGKPFRHVGANVVGMLYSSASEQNTNLQTLAGMGVRHVRLLVPNTAFSKETIFLRLLRLLDRAYYQFNIRLTLVLTDLYGGRCYETESPQVNYYSPPNETSANYRTYPFGEGLGLYNDEWFRDGYRYNYLPLVEYLVYRLNNHPGVFSWQVGGELKNPDVDLRFPPDGPMQNYLTFFSTVSQRIRQRAPFQLVGAGLLNTFHPGLTRSEFLDERLEFYRNPHLHYVSISIYDRAAELVNQRVDPNHPDYRGVLDVDLARAHNKPYVVHEVGFSKGCADKPHYDNPVQRMWDFFAGAYDQYGAGAVMPWGWNFNATGTQDWCYSPRVQGEVQGYTELTRAWSSLLDQRNNA